MSRSKASRSKASRYKKKVDQRLVKIVVVLLAVLLLQIAVLVSCQNRSKEPDPVRPDLTIDPNAQVPTVGYFDSGIGVLIQGFESMTIPSDTKKVKVNFHNPSANEGRFYLTFELRIPDDSEQGYEALYSSGLVLPDKSILEIEMTRGLEKGVYDAFLHVQPYRMDDYLTPVNNADLKIALIVS